MTQLPSFMIISPVDQMMQRHISSTRVSDLVDIQGHVA